ncbi:MAG TPA: diguanylate cyclase [Gammaproteobacteria bacterium]
MKMESPPLLPKIMDMLLDAVCAVDDKGHFVFVSAACERIFGYSQDELIGRNMIDFVFPDDRKRTLQAAADIMSGKPQPHFENRYVRKDGRIVHIMWSACWSESDRLRLAVARDITERKRVEYTQSALYQISEAAHTAEGLFGLYQRIHHIIDKLLPAESFYVALYDKAYDILSFPYFFDKHALQPEPQPLVPGTPIAEIIQSGHALLLNSAGNEVAGNTASAIRHDAFDWLGVPLIEEKSVMGALVIQTYSGKRGYTDDDKQLLHFVSTQITAAIRRKQAETELHHRAHHDALTDLPNRVLFNDRFDVALARARRGGEHLALLYLDLDHFKDVNDTFGHEAGDQLLREVAHRLTQSVRESDTVGRIGGDEFTVLLTDIQGPEYTSIIIDRITSAITAPFELDGQTLTISASIGAAVYPQQGEDKEQLFRQADANMYAVKQCEG